MATDNGGNEYRQGVGQGLEMQFFLTGTGTDIGKTVASAWAVLQLEQRLGRAHYWKPVQTGVKAGVLDGDRDEVARLTGLPQTRFFPCVAQFEQPLSPHEAAKRENKTIDLAAIKLPETRQPLIVEGAGGVLVPLNDEQLMIDLIVQLALPVIVVTDSRLGTINHTLLTLEALRSRAIDIFGVIMNGPEQPHNLEAIEVYGAVPVIAEIPWLEQLSAATLASIAPRRAFPAAG